MSAAVARSLPPVPKPSGKVRWIVCALLFFAVVISYIDRLVLGILKPDLSRTYGWTEGGYADLQIWFQAAYGIGFLISGRLIDRVGARIGYVIAIIVWTAGHVAHALFTTTQGMVLARVPLALGESATYPAALAATSEWFPQRERALAIGILNAGANIGATVTPLIVPVLALSFGWQAAFIATGALSIVWLAAWLAIYRRPREHRTVSAQELAWIESDPAAVVTQVPFRTLLALRQTWAYMAGRFLIDPVWWTFLFWLPSFFDQQFGAKMMQFGPPLIAIYLLADLGSIAGGYTSSKLLGHGWSANRSRKFAMALCAVSAVPVAFAAQAPTIWTAALLIGIACAAHQGFSTNLFALPGDLFPKGTQGSVVGLGGLAGATGSMLMAKFAGVILETVKSYQPIFIAAGGAYLLALLVVHLLVPRWTPVDSARLVR